VHPADQPPPDPDRFLHSLLACHDKLRFEPGSRSNYSNLGPLILVAAMATAAGRPFTELVREEILDPLGMGATAFTFTRLTRPRAAVGYHPQLSPMRPLLPGLRETGWSSATERVRSFAFAPPRSKASSALTAVRASGNDETPGLTHIRPAHLSQVPAEQVTRLWS
jgi:CubicO group peptidase (beta-lactamase class C family)